MNERKWNSLEKVSGIWNFYISDITKKVLIFYVSIFEVKKDNI